MIDHVTRGVLFAARQGVNDAALLEGIWGEDEYNLASLPRLRGWAIDVGAHIGAVTIPLALDNPELQIVAVEAIPENVAVLRRSVALNGLSDRVTVLTMAATDDRTEVVEVTYGWSRADNQPDAYIADNRWIGNMVAPNETSTTIACPGISLSEIVRRFGIERVALLKIDCEGCEYAFLDSSDIDKVDLIIGEYHRGIAGIRRLLEPTHHVTRLSGTDVGHFEARR